MKHKVWVRFRGWVSNYNSHTLPQFIQLDYIYANMKVYRIIMRKLRKVWDGWPKPITIVRVGSGRPRPTLPRGLRRSPRPAARFGSSDPNRLQDLGRTTRIGCKIWVEPPELAAKFGSNNPNWLQDLGRATQIGCKVWVVRPKPAARFGLNDPNRLQGLGRAIWKFKGFLFI
jgi:hypothetical protein